MKKVTRYLLIFCLTIVLIGQITTNIAYADLSGPDIYGEGYCVMDADTGEVIIEKNMNEKYYPASITKVLTALVAIENTKSLSDTITFSESAIHSLTANSSTMNPIAQVGEKMSVKNVLYGLLLCSGNECANALAEYTSGSVEKFTTLMNKKAKEIGATNSNFINAHGLHDENHYSTPYDMALIFREALKNKTFAQIDSTATYTIPKTNKTESRILTMGHKMVNGTIPFDGVFAGKTGRTAEAGRTLLTAAKRNGRTLISVVMKSSDDEFYNDTKILLEYGFGIAEGKMDPVVWEEKEETIWTTGNVKIREFPSVFAKEKGYLPAGSSVTRLATYGDWSKIQYENDEFYVSSDY
ncbi:MAG: serine hydrolase [Lachnospiraceae bacterium]